MTPLIFRLAPPSRIPAAIIGMLSVTLATANLRGMVDDRTTHHATIAVGMAAAAFFLCGVFDPRFHNAASAMNAAMRARTRKADDDRLLLAANVMSILGTLAGAFLNHFPAASLCFAAAMLTALCRIALSARAYPTDRFVI